MPGRSAQRATWSPPPGKPSRDEVDIIVEIHRKLTPMNAIALAEALVDLRLLFYEDPIQIDSIMSQGEIARRISIPVANGERIHSIWEFRELLTHGGPQYVRPDVGLAGGLTHCKKLAAIAESFHCAVVTHNFLGPVLTAASVHLDTSIPNFVTQEYSRNDEAPENAVYRTALRARGRLHPRPRGRGSGSRAGRRSPGPGHSPDDRPIRRPPPQKRRLSRIQCLAGPSGLCGNGRGLPDEPLSPRSTA